MRRIVKGLQVAAALSACFWTLPSSAEPRMAGESYRVSFNSNPYGGVRRQVVLFQRLTDGDAGPTRWVVERREGRRVRGEWKQRHDWIDSRRCEQATSVLAKIDTLPSPVIKGPRPIVDPVQIPPSHAPTVTLDLPTSMNGQFVRLSIQDHHFGPVARWWDAADRALESCWQDAPIIVDGMTIPSAVAEIGDPAG